MVNVSEPRQAGASNGPLLPDPPRVQGIMLIYLDANIVQYCADYGDFIFGHDPLPSGVSAQMRRELVALQRLVEIELELEQLDSENIWHIAAPAHLMKELLAGRPTGNQRDAYSALLQAWRDFGWHEHAETYEERILSIEVSLRALGLRDVADRWHLAEAIAWGASWFLTNDKDIIDKTCPKPVQVQGKVIGIAQSVGIVQGVYVARPSEFIKRVSFDPVFGLTIRT